MKPTDHSVATVLQAARTHMKYVVFKQGNFRVAVLIPQVVVHSLVQLEGGEPESAGFVTLSPSGSCQVHGESASLGLHSDPRDAELIECSFAGGSTYYNGPNFDPSPLKPRKLQWKCQVCGRVTTKPLTDIGAARQLLERCEDVDCGGPVIRLLTGKLMLSEKP